ncbi:uncharacterized protein LOC110117598 [Ceratitis capitata]|uniref:uncharacterized protein LOC110117598 n=1 Tax=Ceratitis capitata TaxID=7213 RepID=UPI000A1104E7|nr:uncharacterized protein LOC110117598 [Ceratitis capitata]
MSACKFLTLSRKKSEKEQIQYINKNAKYHLVTDESLTSATVMDNIVRAVTEFSPKVKSNNVKDMIIPEHLRATDCMYSKNDQLLLEKSKLNYVQFYFEQVVSSSCPKFAR